MTEEHDNSAEDAAEGVTESAPEGPLGGERLAEARREQQISVLEVAKELHLDEAKVRALERNEFDVLGAPVFAKGHLRKYAQLVGVDEGDVFTDYFKMTHTADLPPVVAGRPKIRKEISPGPWIAVIAVIIVAAAAYWWFVVRAGEQAPVTPPAITPVPEQSVDLPSPAAEETVDVAEAAAGDASSPPVEQSRPEPLADDATRISLSFSGDCWTEITDAEGQRLFFNMGRAGRNVDLTGTAPFSVLFGNAENVTMAVNGVDYPITPSTPGSRTARFTIVTP